MSKEKFVVALDAGHGKFTSGKRTPDDEREWYFNSKVVESIEAELKKYDEITLLRLDDRSGKTDVPLITRTNKANSAKADILISVHHNANSGVWGDWTGTETYVYTPASANPRSVKLANCVHPFIVDAYDLKDRGVKAADFHMLRESDMPSILVEGGYMDSKVDIKKLRDGKVLREAGKGIAHGILKYFGIKVLGDTNATHTESIKNDTKKKPAKKPNLKKGKKAETYVIRAGDTLYALAKKFNVSVNDLKKWNKVSEDKLQVGDVLIVAPVVSLTKEIKVKHGDTLWDLARTHDTTVANLKKWNGLTHDFINIGDVLRVK